MLYQNFHCAVPVADQRTIFSLFKRIFLDKRPFWEDLEDNRYYKTLMKISPKSRDLCPGTKNPWDLTLNRQTLTSDGKLNLITKN